MILTWPSTTRQHSVLVASTLADPLLQDYPDAKGRLKHLRARHESIMTMIKMASVVQAAYFMKNGTLFQLPYVGRLMAFVMVSDLLNFNLYYPESREICEVHESLRR